MNRLFLIGLVATGLLLSATAIAQTQETTTTKQTTTTTTNDQSAPSTDQSATPTSQYPSSNDQDASTMSSNDPHSNVRTLTGCLRQGDSSKEFELMGQDGSTWELRSDAVDLASHVGHTVAVTGAVSNTNWHNMKEDAKKEAQEHGVDKSGTEHGHLTVTNLQMVSETCTPAR